MPRFKHADGFHDVTAVRWQGDPTVFEDLKVQGAQVTWTMGDDRAKVEWPKNLPAGRAAMEPPAPKEKQATVTSMTSSVTVREGDWVVLLDHGTLSCMTDEHFRNTYQVPADAA